MSDPTTPAAPRVGGAFNRSNPLRRGRAEERALVAHVLRRATFGPAPGQVDELASLGAAALIDQLLAAEPLDPDMPELGSDNDEGRLIDWWTETMADPAAGLHEKMVWWWHGHLTSSLDKTDPALMLRQHRLLRTHALGNFRELLQEIAVDAAMLHWLDGADSTADAPNENFGREVMELFALGHGSGYTEADVRAAAYSFSGWTVDDDNGSKVVFDDAGGPQRFVTLLGRDGVRGAKAAIDTICDQPACARHIAASVYSWLVGAAPSEAVGAELATTFRDANLDIATLVAAVMHHPDFLAAVGNRPRTPVEWSIAAERLLDVRLDSDVLDALGQVPFRPPNVAGWPGSQFWMSSAAVFTKASAAWDNSGDTEVVGGDAVSKALSKAGIDEVSDETRAALSAAIGEVEGRRDAASVLHALVLCSPEFNQA